VTAGSGTYDAHGDVRGDVTKGMLRVWFSSSANVTLLFTCLLCPSFLSSAWACVRARA